MRTNRRFLALALLGTASAWPVAATDLTDAVQQGDVAAVRTLLARGAAIDEAEPDGSTALHWAAQSGNLEITDLLLASGADPSAATRYSITPLSLAASIGSAPVMESLLKAGADPNRVTQEDQTPLMLAARNGKVDALRVLLREGVQVNAAESYRGQTALMLAAGEGNTVAVELLLEFGADLHVRSKGDFTALLFAVRNNQPETVKFLLDHGANVNDALPDGTAALNMAVLNADYDLASLLLDYDANPDSRDPRGTPLHSVVWLHEPGAPPDFAMSGVDPQPPPLPSGRLSHLDIARKLIEKGADPNAEVQFTEGRFSPGGGLSRNPPNLAIGRHFLTYTGATPYYLAARNGDAPMMRVLFEGGADPNRTNIGGVTPLMGAACLDYYEGESPGPFNGLTEDQRLEAVKLAIELGNDVNARTTFGDYPMIGTPEGTLIKYPDNIGDILDLGLGDPRFDEMTALHGAVLCNQPKILQYLIDQGAEVEARSRLGWTPLMIAEKGLYIANNLKLFPAAAEILRNVIAERGLAAQK